MKKLYAKYILKNLGKPDSGIGGWLVGVS